MCVVIALRVALRGNATRNAITTHKVYESIIENGFRIFTNS